MNEIQFLTEYFVDSMITLGRVMELNEFADYSLDVYRPCNIRDAYGLAVLQYLEL